MGRGNQKAIGSDASANGSQTTTGMVEENSECGQPAREKTAKKATATELKALLDVQQYCCALSGLPLTPEDAALDHIVAVSDGGTHEVNNLQWLNAEVNRMKGSMSQSRFIAIVKLIAANT
jgi:5-methylcytosine-specific restriction endonuclease McrA